MRAAHRPHPFSTGETITEYTMIVGKCQAFSVFFPIRKKRRIEAAVAFPSYAARERSEDRLSFVSVLATRRAVNRASDGMGCGG
jgi:hypothetical protein